MGLEGILPTHGKLNRRVLSPRHRRRVRIVDGTHGQIRHATQRRAPPHHRVQQKLADGRACCRVFQEQQLCNRPQILQALPFLLFFFFFIIIIIIIISIRLFLTLITTITGVLVSALVLRLRLRLLLPPGPFSFCSPLSLAPCVVLRKVGGSFLLNLKQQRKGERERERKRKNLHHHTQKGKKRKSKQANTISTQAKQMKQKTSVNQPKQGNQAK
jgi:hypothetical protein